MANTHVVVGGAGFIGSHLVDALLARGDKVIVIDNLYSGSLENLVSAKKNKNFILYDADITNYQGLDKIFFSQKQRVDTIFNLATVGLLRSLINPDWSCLQELMIAQICVNCIRLNFANKLVHFSTSEVFGDTTMPADNMTKKIPTTPYAVGKLAAENYIKVMIDLFNLNAIVIRPFNNFGYRQTNFEYQGIIPKTIRLLAKGKSVPIYGDGSQTRDFIYVGDTLKRLFIILDFHFNKKNKDIFKPTVYQIAGKEISILGLVKMIANIGNFKCNVTFEPKRPGDIQRLTGLDTLLFGRELPKLTPLEDSIKYLIDMEKKCV